METLAADEVAERGDHKTDRLLIDVRSLAFERLFGTTDHSPLLLKSLGIISSTQGGQMKNLKDLWERSPELVDGIGGERLAGSGFEREEPHSAQIGGEPGQEEEE